MTQKKILFVNTVCGAGSTGRIVHDLYTRAKENGYKCAVAYGRGEPNGVPVEDTYKVGSKISLYRTVLWSRIVDGEGFHLKSQTKKFLEFVDSFAPDIVHLHNIHGYYLNCEMLFNYLAAHKEIKVVWTLHDMWVLTGRCAFVDAETCPKWLEGCHDCTRRYIYPKTMLLDKCEESYEKKKKLFNSVENMPIVLLRCGCNIGFVVFVPHLAPLSEGVVVREINAAALILAEGLQLVLDLLFGSAVKMLVIGFAVVAVAEHDAQLPATVGSAAKRALAVHSSCHIAPFPVWMHFAPTLYRFSDFL